jgi:phospholipid-binding lipoprotein MlaA
MRDAYLQRRASQVQDGLVPSELLQDEFEPEDDEPAKATSAEQAVVADTVVLQSDAPIEDNAVALTSQAQPVAVEESAVTPEPATPDVAADITETPAATESQEALPPLLDQVSEQPAVEEEHVANVVAGVDETLLTLEAQEK